MDRTEVSPRSGSEPRTLRAPWNRPDRDRYAPVTYGPDLDLSTVDLNDGSYSTTKIYPVNGVPGHTDVQETIGDFSTQFAGNHCAYDLPGGAISMHFTPARTSSPFPMGQVGPTCREPGN